MIRTRSRLALVGIALLVAATALPPSIGTVGTAGTAVAAEHSFVVEQGGQCYEVSPLRGDEDVVSFYDYRNIDNTDDSTQYTYSSFMPDHLTREDASRLFLYEGPDGVSLVMVHNERSSNRDDGTAVTFRFDGLPSAGDWVVEDDDYSDQDDRYYRNRIDWSFYGDRTDGAAFRGLDRSDTAITISPAFDEEAALYDEPVDRDGHTDAWEFLTGNLGDPSAVSLDTDQPVTIRTGTCGPDETAPSAALSAEDGVVGHSVTFDARDSTDEGGSGIAEYRWDFDGDGEVEQVGADPTVTHTYDEAGTYDATVTVVDGAENEDSASEEVQIEADDPPEAAFSVGDSPTEGFPVTFDAGNSTDELGIAEYRWDFDGDGEAESRTEDPTVPHTYEEAGDYEVGLTVVDSGGQNATVTRTVSVGEDSPPEAAIRVVSPEKPVEDEEVVLSASNATDDTGIAEYRWSFGGNATATGERVAYTFDGNGTFEVTLEVVDEGGNNATTQIPVEVLPPDETPPSAALEANRTNVTVGELVGFAANESNDDRSIASYDWDFGDGADASGRTATHAYGSAGNYTATVVVTDGGGNRDTANVTIHVREPDETPPSAELSVGGNDTETETKTRKTLQFDASNSTDEGSAGIGEYVWDFDGDGEPDQTTSGATVEYAYDSTGNYTATVTVRDRDGNADNASVSVNVTQNRQAHRGNGGGGSGGGGNGGSAGGGGGGAVSTGPPPVQTQTEERGPNSGLVDVRNARADETVRADLPASEVATDSGVRFRSIAVDLARDDPHFVVETARPAEKMAEGSLPADSASLPADVLLGSLSVSPQFVESGQVERVTYEVTVERSLLEDEGLAPADLRAYQRTGGGAGDADSADGAGGSTGAWEQANLSVVERGETVVLRIRTDGFAPIALGANRPVTVAAVELTKTEVAANEAVSVTATLRNEGGDGESVALNLTANSEVVATKTVSVPAEKTTQVSIEATLPPGTHSLALDNQSVGNVTVAEPTAEISVSEVSLNSSTVAAGERVAITATVENSGSKQGEETVALTLFGEGVATETVAVPANATSRVTFVRSVDAAGTYTVKVGNASATLEVTGQETTTGDEPTGPDVPIPGFGAGVSLVALVVVLLGALVVARRRE